MAKIRLIPAAMSLVISAIICVALTPPTAHGAACTITGTGGPDTLIGTSGPDVICGLGGADTLVGAGGNDELLGGRGGDTLRGGGGDDHVNGARGNDAIQGNKGNDNLYPGIGDDTVDGGEGKDVGHYFNTPGSGIVLDLSTGQVTGGTGADTLTRIEDVVGTPFADVLKGDAGSNLISGNDGNDDIDGGPGNDILDGQGGSDGVTAREGHDSISGGGGDDTLYPGMGTDSANGGDGTDTVDYNDVTDAGMFINLPDDFAGGGSGGNDQLTSIENAIGSQFSDDIIGTDGINFLSGGPGDDDLYPRAGDDNLFGGDGFDFVNYLSQPGPAVISLISGTATGVGNDTLNSFEGVRGTQGNDSIYGDDSANQLDGHDGNDTIYPNLGDDTVVGGAGSDTVSFFGANSSSGVNVNLQTGTATGHGNDSLNSIANIEGTPFADTLVATLGATASTIYAYGGSDHTSIEDGSTGDFHDCGAGTDYARADSGDGGAGCEQHWD